MGKHKKGVFWFYFCIFALNFCQKKDRKQYQKCIFQYRFGYFDAKSTRPLPTQAGHRDPTEINSTHGHLPPITRPEKMVCWKKRWFFFWKKSEIFKNISRKSRFAKKRQFIVIIFLKKCSSWSFYKMEINVNKKVGIDLWLTLVFSKKEHMF